MRNAFITTIGDVVLDTSDLDITSDAAPTKWATHWIYHLIAETASVAFGTFLSGATSVQRPNLIAGVPLWISDPNVAGGKRINKAAFSVPVGAVQGNLGRNALNGFSATQVDFTLRRQFKLYERLSLQARADFFNIFNIASYANPDNTITDSNFGQITNVRSPARQTQLSLHYMF